MKSLLILLSLLSASYSFAGDAGYFSRTCVSASQRTVLTILNDYTENAPIYTLIVDGVPAVYNLNDTSVNETGDDGVLTISKSGTNIFKTDFNVNNGQMTLTIYQDPRMGTIAEHGATAVPINVSLKCKDFWPNP